MNIFAKAARVVRSPGAYARFALKLASVGLTRSFAGLLRPSLPAYLQSRMDIDPASAWHSRDFAVATGGFSPPGSASREIVEVEPWDRTRRDMLVLLLRTIEARGVPGAFAELGVWQGATARLFHRYSPDRKLYLFDTFAGFGDRGVREERARTGHGRAAAADFSDTSEERVRAFIASRNDNVHLIKGFFPDSIPPSVKDEKFAFVHLDADLHGPIAAGLDFFYPRMAPGGIIVVHDYNAWPGARQAVDEFLRRCPEVCATPMPDKSGSCVLQRPVQA